MKLWVFSDIHLEVENIFEVFVNFDDADICVIPGDLTNRSPADSIRWIAKNIRLPTVFVAGNHEFYGGALLDGLEEAKEVAKSYPHIHFLENDCAEIGGVRFVGATLWTDFNIYGDPVKAIRNAAFAMNDYYQVALQANPFSKLTPFDTQKLHFASRRFLESVLTQPFSGKTVVVTHHCPHPMSVPERFKGSQVNAAFTSDLSKIIEKYRPDLWLHGHTHDSFDYEVEGTRVVCNPRGYGRENRDFNPRLIVEI